ncbi:MAG TPA: YcxB family protein [Polyangia bacterium]|nr:YcxB family protein [Polyangia bacterium]
MSEDAASDTITGALELEARDLHAAIIDASWLLRARFGIAAFLAFSYGMLAFTSHAPASQMFGPILCGAVLVASLFVTPRLRARKLLEALAKGGDRHASYRFDADGVTFRTAGSTTTSAYRSIGEYREGEAAFLLYHSPGVAHIIPKRAFSPGDVARVRALLAANAKVKRARGVGKVVIVWFALILTFLVVWQFLSQAPPPRPRATAAVPSAVP